MFRTLLRRCSTQITPTLSPQVIDTQSIPNNDVIHYKSTEDSVLEPCKEDISHVAPYLKPSFNFAAYVNKSETLQHLVKLGVNLYKLEKNRNTELPPYILGLDFEKNIKNHVLFLTDLGVENDQLGGFITKNPWFFKEDLEDLKVRINYLKAKKFTDDMIVRVVQTNSLWLSFSTQDIDQKLGFFQKQFYLSGPEVRKLAAKSPRLITSNLESVKLNTFVIKEEMGFAPEELKEILLNAPKLFMKNQHFLLKTFEYLHRKMEIPLERILQEPRVLTCREFRLKQRHLFLQKLGKIQFDHKKPNYISLSSIVSGNDSHFAVEVAGSSVQIFNTFLKSL